MLQPRRRLRITKRQQQIIDLLLEGNENGAIAESLGIKESWVKSQLLSLFSKFNIVDGCKRVKLAVMMYREKQCQLNPSCLEVEQNLSKVLSPPNANTTSLSL